jgi:tRNA-intron endonuclease
MDKFTAELIGDRLIVWDPEEGSKLYKMGYYGKPVGISKPKLLDFDVPLNIDLIEGLYLLEKGIIKVVKSDRKRHLSLRSMKSHARKVYDDFESHYVVYKDLRDKGYIVLSGIKFGCEFAVYERGPGIDHAPYLISVRQTNESLTSTDIVRAGRLATTVRKRFIVAVPDLTADEHPYIVFKWFKA